MKIRVFAAVALVLAGSFSAATAAVSKGPARASQDQTSNVDIYSLNQSVTSSPSGELWLYSPNDKEHVFTLGPQNIPDPSTQTTGGNYAGQLSPAAQKNIGVAFGAPLDGADLGVGHLRGEGAGEMPTRADVPPQLGRGSVR